MIGASNAAAVATMEVWSVIMTQYLSVVCMVLVHCDWLLTLNGEVCLLFSSLDYPTACSQIPLVRSGALSWPTALYYANRYVTITVW